MRKSAGLSLLVALISIVTPASALACSPPFDPSIEALGPGQIVVVGTTGEPVARGRLFHVERWYNGGPPVTPIIIAFKEGEPTGDCSYPVTAGTHLLIAPVRLDDGSLYADLATLQADPASETGRAYVAEAERLFGPGVVPVADATTDASVDDAASTDPLPPLVLGAVVGALVGVVAAIVAWRRRSPA